jgi:hypothetical protein
MLITKNVPLKWYFSMKNKLKPSFSIIKDIKAKDRAGVADKPHPQILTDELILI